MISYKIGETLYQQNYPNINIQIKLCAMNNEYYIFQDIYNGVLIRYVPHRFIEYSTAALNSNCRLTHDDFLLLWDILKQNSTRTDLYDVTYIDNGGAWLKILSTYATQMPTTYEGLYNLYLYHIAFEFFPALLTLILAEYYDKKEEES